MQSVAVIPVRRSVFDDKLKCKYRTFPGSVSDDVVKVMREGESGKNQMEMQKLIGEPDWGSGVIEWENGEEIADIQIDIKNQHFEGKENIPKVHRSPSLIFNPNLNKVGNVFTMVLLNDSFGPNSA